MTSSTREVQLKEMRPKRVPLHEQRKNRLSVIGADPKYHYRVFNDTDDRVEKAKLAGYELAPEKMLLGDANVDNTNNAIGSGTRTHVGGGTQGVLMRIPKELFIEDQAAKQRDIFEKERLIKRKKQETRDDGLIGEVEIKR